MNRIGKAEQQKNWILSITLTAASSNNNNNTINNNNSQTIGFATTMSTIPSMPIATMSTTSSAIATTTVVATTTITTIISQNPCQTIITSTSYTPSLNATLSYSTTATAASTTNCSKQSADKVCGNLTNFTTCNPQYLRLLQSSSYYRRHSVSGIYWFNFHLFAFNFSHSNTHTHKYIHFTHTAQADTQSLR